jgi:hypothetical protein
MIVWMLMIRLERWCDCCFVECCGKTGWSPLQYIWGPTCTSQRQSILAFTRRDDEHPYYCAQRFERIASRLVVATVLFSLVTRLVSTPRLCKGARPEPFGIGRTDGVESVEKWTVYSKREVPPTKSLSSQLEPRREAKHQCWLETLG